MKYDPTVPNMPLKNKVYVIAIVMLIISGLTKAVLPALLAGFITMMIVWSK